MIDSHTLITNDQAPFMIVRLPVDRKHDWPTRTAFYRRANLSVIERIAESMHEYSFKTTVFIRLQRSAFLESKALKLHALFGQLFDD